MADKKMCATHPDRPARRGDTCSSCYDPTPREEYVYVHSLIDELEIRGGTWPELTEKYKRSIDTLSKALRKKERQDLIDKVKFATYGVIRQSDIVSVVNSQRKENA